ncbi:hypothetical protein PYCCODRAFT_1370341 [Trametes coccinea BRFM310]|uniref:T6SS Phospholipase effector Tle1-like catalytic domain-containing protein n=1 Tax=Trametes coccinea (strain BRFM310) TaxID=1353009 RepID=A0A1Y2II83_TRAC3|nr:hypothetical protein PYCCODRAFT_1370341 [Trametes coccinea BRFM310]
MPSSTPNSPSSLAAHSRSQAASGRTSSDSGHSRLRPTTPTSVHSSSSELGDNDIIPPPDPAAARTLVLCFDGTGDQFDSDTSNVIKFFSMLKKDDRREQMVYYQSGIGTYTTPQVTTTIGQFVSKTMDEMVAWNLDAHVMSGYEFLMENYEAGDKICLFGFSRGAYTARALAGMLHKVGLLPPDNYQQIPFAYKMYTRTDELGWKQSTAFKKAFCLDVSIDFIGVWQVPDTVCSVGIIPHRLPFTASNTAIRTFRHALSLDERRAKFKANNYNRPTPWESKQGTHPGDMPRPSRRSQAKVAMNKLTSAAKARLKNVSTSSATTAVAARTATPDGAVKAAAVATAVVEKVEKKGSDDDEEVKLEATAAATETTRAASTISSQTTFWMTARSKFDTLRTLMRKKGKRLTEEEEAFDKADPLQCQTPTDVKEVWFAGCHCDVGGGSVPDDTPHALERIPLRWMIRECFRTNTGIRFHGELLKRIGLDPATLWPEPQPSHSWDADSFVYPGETSAPSTPEKFAPPPSFSVITATPMEKTQDEIARVERAATLALNNSSSMPLVAPKPLPPLAVHSQTRTAAQQHGRDVSTSTTQTLVNGIESQMLSGPSAASALAPSGWGPDSSINEVEEERLDARSKIYDQLSRCPLWWLLEFLPIEQRIQRPKDHVWEKHYRINLGRGRDVQPTEQFFLHRSVKYRMDLKDLEDGPYRPRARWPSCVKPVYVD